MPVYEITRSGAAFLIGGFTGPEAGAFKEAYIDEFDRMEAALKARPAADNVVSLDELRRLPAGIKALLVGLEEDRDAAERRAVAAEHEKAALAQEKAEIAQYSAELAAKFDQAAQFVAAFQRLVNTDGLVLVSDIAKVLHIPKDEMFDRLYKAGFIYKRGPRKPWLARDRYVREGLFDHKFWTQTLDDGTRIDRPQLYATRKGVERIALLFGTDGDGGQGRFAFGMH
jgi:phage antirepressor YoqD-like protein